MQYRTQEGKRYRIKDHPRLKDIEHDLVIGKTYKSISNQYDILLSSLSHYKKRHLSKKSNTYSNNKDYRDGEVIYQTLGKYIDNVNKIANSVLKALEDPDNPELLDVGINSKDITLTYQTIAQDGREVKKRANLQTLIDEYELSPVRIEINTPDRIQTLIQASHAMNKHLHLLGDLKGMIGNTTVNITNQPVFIEFTQHVIQALQAYPEAREAVAEHIRTIGLTTDSIGNYLTDNQGDPPTPAYEATPTTTNPPLLSHPPKPETRFKSILDTPTLPRNLGIEDIVAIAHLEEEESINPVKTEPPSVLEVVEEEKDQPKA